MDRLAAWVQGIFRAFGGAFPDDFDLEDHVLGLWNSILNRCLLWHRITYTDGFSDMVSSLESYAPSWSWIGCPGPVKYYSQASDLDAIPLIKIIKAVSVNASELGSFGPNTGCLVISGNLIPVTRYMRPYIAAVHFRFLDSFKRKGHPPPQTPALEAEMDNSFDPNAIDTVTHFLPLLRAAANRGTTEGIFLAPVTTGEDSRRKRVSTGRICARCCAPSPMASSETRSILPGNHAGMRSNLQLSGAVSHRFSTSGYGL